MLLPVRPITCLLPSRPLLLKAVIPRLPQTDGYLIAKRYISNETKAPCFDQLSAKQKDILHRLISKSKFLTKLNNHPRFAKYFDRISETGAVSTITSFLILHELSAIIPLFGIWWVMYQLDLPDQTEFPEFLSKIMVQCGNAMERFVGDKYPNFDRHKLILSGTLSYMIVKLLYPLRIIVSLWGAPYFGKWLFLPFQNMKGLITKK